MTLGAYAGQAVSRLGVPEEGVCELDVSRARDGLWASRLVEGFLTAVWKMPKHSGSDVRRRGLSSFHAVPVSNASLKMALETGNSGSDSHGKRVEDHVCKSGVGQASRKERTRVRVPFAARACRRKESVCNA